MSENSRPSATLRANNPMLRATILAAWIAATPLPRALGQQPEQGVEMSAPSVTSTPFVINDADPESSVPPRDVAMKRPLDMGYLMMELSDRAELAKKKNDFAHAAKYYRAIAKAVPDRAIAFDKACEAHAAAEQWQEANEMCRTALGLSGVNAQMLIRFVRVTLRKVGMLPASDVDDIETAIEQLRSSATDEQGKQIASELACDLSVRIEDATRARACIASLKELHEPDAKVVAYEWALAVMEKDESRAREIASRAKQLGLPKGVLDSMESGLNQMLGKQSSQLAPSSGGNSGLPSWLPIGAMIGLVLAAAAVVLRRRSRSA